MKCLLVFGQNDTDIFTQILTDYALKVGQLKNNESQARTILVLKKPKYRNNLENKDYKRFKEKFKKLEQSTFENFIEKQNMEIQLDNVKVKNADIILLNNEQACDAKNLLSKYPNQDYYLHEISNVGYNDLGSQALVYYGYSGLGIGGGIYAIYKRKANRWKGIKIIPAWAT